MTGVSEATPDRYPSAGGGGPRSSFDRVRRALEAHGCRIQSHGLNSFKATCPAHEDPGPSLHVTWKDRPADGGLTVLKCFGCDAATSTLTEIIGLTQADLFDEPLKPRPRNPRSQEQRRNGQRRGKLGRLPEAITSVSPPSPRHEHQWQEVARYPYLTRDGVLVQEVIRVECSLCADEGRHTKEFWQRFVTKQGRRVQKAPPGFERVLYRTPQVAAAIQNGNALIYLLEGEKDVHTAEGLGLIATTNTQGGRSVPPEVLEVLADAHVVVVLDRDPTGWARGVDLHKKLTDIDARVQLKLPAVDVAKADFTDHIEAGHRVEELVDVHVDEVRPWHALTAVREKAKLVDQAIREALARYDRAESGEEPEDNYRYAKRWVLEAQIRHEALRQKAAEVEVLADKTGTVWAIGAIDAANETLRGSIEETARCHRQLGVALPPVLRPAHEPQAQTDSDQTALGSTSTTADVVVTASGGDPSSWSPRQGGTATAPIFRVLDGQIVQWEPDRASRRRDDDWDEEPAGKFKVLLSTVVRVTCREYLELEADTNVDQVELLGRSKPARRVVSAPRTLAAVRLEFPDPATAEMMEIRVHADQWRDHSWLESLPGHPDYDHKRAGLDQLQRAILAISTEIADEVLYRSTGWRETPDGRHEFIHRRGAITAEGHRSIEVAFSGPIQRYDLPDPVRDPGVIRQAWLEGSATLLDRLPDRVAAPLLGQVYRSVLGHNEWVVTLVGSPGSYKTSVAAKLMHHFGERWDHKRPTSSMSGNGDTFNALRLKLHYAKDCLYWMDDFAPTKSWLEAQRNLEESARLVHNAEERSRTTRDGQSVNDGTGPRASALCTSEVNPRPGSAADRMLVIPLSRHDVDTALLFPLDQQESRHQRALVMASFISWLAADLVSKRERYVTIAAGYADALVQHAGETVRQAAALAHTWIGWVAVTDFLTDLGAITASERDQTLGRVNASLHEAGRAAHNPDMPRNTGARVVELLAFALRQGIAYVDDVRTGQCPPWPLAGRLGWRETVLDVDGIGHPSKIRQERNGMRLGYVCHDPTPRERGRVLMCESTQLEAVLKAAGSHQAERLEIDRATATRALLDEGVLIYDHAEGRDTVWCRVHAENRKARMITLHLDKIIGDDGEDGDGDYSNGWDSQDPDGTLGSVATPPAADAAAVVPTAGASDPHLVDSAQVSEHPGSLTEDHHPGVNGSDQPQEEEASVYEDFVSRSWTDRDGNVAWTQPHPAGDGGSCLVCGRRSGILLSGQWVHPLCWERSTAADRNPLPAAEAPTTTAVPAAPDRTVADDNAPSPTARAGKPEQPARRAERPAAVPQPQAFRAAAAVVDVDGVWLSNGESLPLDPKPRHVGELVQLAEQLQLGTYVTPERKDGGKRRRVEGQVWVADRLARDLGIDVDAIIAATDGDKEEATKVSTRNAAGVTEAVATGYSLGGGSDDLGRWTRVWKGTDRSIWVVLLPALSRDPKELPLMGGDPDHPTLARRIGLLASNLSYPYHLSSSTTGLDLMSDLRYLDRDRLFAARTSLVEPEEMNVEADLSWCRNPTAEEAEHTWVHAYDRSGSYLAGVSGLELGIGEPVHHAEGRPFDRKLPGYWLAEIPEPGDWRMPNVLDPRGRSTGKVRWLTTPSVEFALEQGHELKIMDAYTWPEHGRLLDSWYERIRDARTALDIDDPDALAARDQLKQIYAATIGMLGSHVHMKGRDGYAPARRHMIIAKARTNILRRVAKIGQETGRWPVAIVTDTVLYTSPEADPVKAWPGGQAWLGRALGRYKVEGSARLEDHLPFLTGGNYKGKDAIVPPQVGAE